MLILILLVFAFVMSVVAGVTAAPAPPGLWSWRLLCWSLACYFLAEIFTRGGSVLH